ncbi:MAG: hypothetical protein CMI79_05430 [Candidatus Pelagibacter sp.]|nr:hypothetical protein [Candidatus Pelagibacter sp.]|tara:strand:- start:10707 stop:10934 length:228 start_codon:yes stop_codon:yes gene_type:complete
MKYINTHVFLISLVVGALFIYVSAEPTETVLVYPTPENAGKYEYVDKSGNCYRYHAEKMPCPKEKKILQRIPIQE